MVNVVTKTNKKSILVATSLSISYGDKTILDNVSISINPKDKIGIVGLNGSGKTTLMKILVGEEQPDHGTIKRNGLKIGYLKQNENKNSDTLLKDYITQDCTETNLDSQIEKIMKDLNLNINLGRTIGEISGGELVKISILKLLIQNPDMLILDEPTNHLDIHANFWLRNFLQRWNRALLITSHDRDFLNEVVDKIVELENCKLTAYGGNYDFFLMQKGLMEEAQKREIVRLEKNIKKVKRLREKEKERASHSARKDISRRPDDNDRARANFFKEKATKSAGRNRYKIDNKLESLNSDLEKVSIKERKRIDPMLLSTDYGYKGNLLVKLNEFTCGYSKGNTVLNVKDFEIKFGDRIAIFGRNGSGKSTLLKAICGDTSIVSNGDIARKADLNIVMLDQQYNIVNRDISALENMLKYFPSTSLTDIRRHLANFLFTGDIVNMECKHLSGGEIARLVMAIITVLPIDILLLDEPTNNLDIQSIEEIESSLRLFNGAVVCISHDLSFLNNIEIGKAYIVKDMELRNLANIPNDGEYFRDELLKIL